MVGNIYGAIIGDLADSILYDQDYEKYLRHYIKKYMNYKPNFEPYFRIAFSPSLIKWASGSGTATSIGNGAMMRVSPVGYLFNTEELVIKKAVSMGEILIRMLVLLDQW